ncbi:hypothetical protein [Blastococcus sp. SYSU D00813]
MRAVPTPPRRPLLAGAALALALPLLAAPSPAAADDPAPRETVVGELVQGYADPGPHEAGEATHADAGLLSWIETAPGEAVRVPTEDLPDVGAGATVEVTVGAEVDDEAADAGMEPAREVLAAEVVAEAEPPAAPAATPVNHPVTVVMVQPAGSVRDGTTLAAVMAAVNGPVADFWEEQTNGAVRFGTVAGLDWPAQASSIPCSSPFALWQEAATRANWNGAPGAHLLLYVPAGSPGCAYGLGTIGDGLGDGGLVYVQAPELSVVAHEFGHNLGLGHSSLLVCDGQVDGGACAVDPYYDMYDVMGISWGPVGSLSAPQAARLGTLPGGSAPTVASGAAATEVTLTAVGSRSGTRAVRLTDVDGDEYWLEYRTPVGRDSWLGTGSNWAGLQSGVLLRVATDADGDSSLLLDGTPAGQPQWGSDNAVALPAGTAVSFGDASFSVRVLESGGTTARVSIASAPGTHPMDAAYPRLRAVLGAATSPRVCGLRDGGCFRFFQRGSMYWSPSSGAHAVRGAIRGAWGFSGWEAGRLGYPIGEEVCGLRDGGCAQHFQRGSVYWSPTTGAQVVLGAIRDRWAALGWEAGRLGYPLGNEVCGLPAGGCFQQFRGGSVYWSPQSGSWSVVGGIRNKWAAQGWERGWLGYPVGDEVCGLRDGGCAQHFQRGSVFWSPATRAHVVVGAIRDGWAGRGWERGLLGYPVSDERCGLRAGGCFQLFQGGSVYWSPTTGPMAVRGALRDQWARMGWENSRLGYPIRDEACVRGSGCSQQFQFGWLAA